MPSPVAHSLAGLALALAVPAPQTGRLAHRALWGGLIVVSANAPDLDFGAGLVAGSVNAFHGGPSHSVAAALVYTAVVTALCAARTERRRVALTIGAAYLSHLALDVLCALPGHPNRLALAWPVTSARWTAPFHVFSGILHGRPGADLSGFLREVFSRHNLEALAIEVIALAPLVALGWFVGRRISAPLRTRAPD